MPRDRIESAIAAAERSAADSPLSEQIVYEGNLGRVLLLVEAATDNRNRTIARVRHLLREAGGAVSSKPGSVLSQFRRRGLLQLRRGANAAASDDQLLELAITAGAEDVELSDTGEITLFTEPTALLSARDALRSAEPDETKLKIESCRLVYLPLHGAVELSPGSDADEIASLDKLVDQLEEEADVQEVTHNAVVMEEESK